jgi:parallel beta-helix repeat protein
MRKWIAGLVVVCLIITSMYQQPVKAADLYVSTSGTDSGNCQTSPCRTIGYAVGQASSNDTIHVAAGTYDIETFPVQIFKNLNLIGADASSTIIHNTDTTEDVIEIQSFQVNMSNFTVKGGDDGVYLADGATGTISHNIITGSASNGVSIVSASPTIENNLIYDCDDGVQTVSGSTSTIMNNTITGNAKKGIRTYDDIVIINNVITNNGSDGVYCDDCDSTITNNTIVGNGNTGIYVILAAHPKIFNNIIVSNGKGEECIECAGIHDDDSTIADGDLDYNDVWDNGPGGTNNYSGVLYIGSHDLSANPLLTGDYHLQCSSPALDAGSNTAPEIPSTDKDGEARIQNLIVDMGAYEGCIPTPAAAPRKLPSLLPLAQNNFLKGGDLARQMDDLLIQAKSKNLNTDLCEKLIDEAINLLAKAKKNMTNPIYANNLALEAQKKLNQAIDCLKALLG